MLSSFQCLYALNASFPLPSDKINEYPFNMAGKVQSGETITDLGVSISSSSGVAISQKVVLSAAHTFFNDEILDWRPEPYRWNLRHSPSDPYYDMSARSYLYFSDYAEATRRFYFGGSPSQEQQNRDVIVLIFYEDVADGGWAGRGVNRIDTNIDKMIVGYPSGLYSYSDNDPRMDTMHSTSLEGSPAKFTLIPYADKDRLGATTRVFETHDLSTGPGGSGGPVFGLIPFTDGTFDWGVVGIVVGGYEASSTIAVNFDEDVYELLKEAEATTYADGTLILGGSGDIVGENIQHPNGNVFNQVLLTGPHITFKANPRQITRASFMDEDGDIVQVEFSGAGRVTVILDPATYLPPSRPSRYNQQVKYVTGKPSVLIEGADSTSFLSIFTVGRINAVNQTLFPEGQVYDAMADVTLVEVKHSKGFGGMQLSNTVFSRGGNSPRYGVIARRIPIAVRLTIGDINPRNGGVAHILFGSGSFTVPAANSGVRITGGVLGQYSGTLIVVAESGSLTPGFDTLITKDNFKSDGSYQPKQKINAVFINENATRIPIDIR